MRLFDFLRKTNLNLELDKENKEFWDAVNCVLYGEDRLIFVTGKAGTGKTTFLKYIKDKRSDVVILAPTGVAALNAGGQTLHSFFQIDPNLLFVKNDKRLRHKRNQADPNQSIIYDYFKYGTDKLEIIKNLDILIIDEVSMVMCNLMDVIDRLLRVFRKNFYEPFGGVKVVLIGDPFQLKPVDKNFVMLENDYESPYFFHSDVIKKNKMKCIELKKIYRQSDTEFIDLLNKIRIKEIPCVDYLESLNKRVRRIDDDTCINLKITNNSADQTNQTKLDSLKGKEYTYEAIIIGIFPPGTNDNNYPTNKTLKLKVGAKIMFVKNNWSKGYCNGTLGKIVELKKNEIIAEIEDNFGKISRINIEKEKWENISYVRKKNTTEGEVIGTFLQYPIKLAWAITVHKSQGLSFARVFAEVGGSFTHGQVYVALSRCKSLDGLVLENRIEEKNIIVDKEVLEFATKINKTPT